MPAHSVLKQLHILCSRGLTLPTYPLCLEVLTQTSPDSLLDSPHHSSLSAEIPALLTTVGLHSVHSALQVLTLLIRLSPQDWEDSPAPGGGAIRSKGCEPKWYAPETLFGIVSARVSVVSCLRGQDASHHMIVVRSVKLHCTPFCWK